MKIGINIHENMTEGRFFKLALRKVLQVLDQKFWLNRLLPRTVLPDLVTATKVCILGGPRLCASTVPQLRRLVTHFEALFWKKNSPTQDTLKSRAGTGSRRLNKNF